jgi:hypothetical protein
VPDLPVIVTVQGAGCGCATPSLQPGETMTTRLTDYVRALVADGCVTVVEHPDNVQTIIADGNAVDGTPQIQQEGNPQP